MHIVATIAALCVLANTSLASYRVARLDKRQGDSFHPDTFPSDCDPSDGFVHCGANLCIIPSRGDVCCDPSQNWGCPGGSFCLVDGLCCPDGLDSQTCARNNGVSLPPDFGTSAAPSTKYYPSTTSTTSYPSTSSTSFYSPITPTTSYPSTTSTPSYLPTTSSSTYPSFSSSVGNYTTPSTSYQPPSPPPTGAANALQNGALVAKAVGLAAWLAAAL
jgi:hypothetical protein